MITKIEFKNEAEKINIINSNKDKYLIEEMYLIEGNFLVFSDFPNNGTLLAQHNNKILALEKENESLKQELSVTQDAVNELIFNLFNI